MKQKIHFPILDAIQEDIISLFSIANGFEFIYSLENRKALIVDKNNKSWFIQVKDNQIFMYKRNKLIPIIEGGKKVIGDLLDKFNLLAKKTDEDFNFVVKSIRSQNPHRNITTADVKSIYDMINQKIEAEGGFLDEHEDFINDEELLQWTSPQMK